MLFAEASLDQIDVIKHCLEEFCLASGQQINREKTKMCCSANVNINRSLQLASELGITLTCDLGRYLGIPLLHKKATKLTFASISGKVSNKLSGWKRRHLNIAGRTVLIKSVLSALPSYFMQTLLLPKGIIEDLHKTCRSFLWNSSPQEKKAHLVSWDSVTSIKENGGLGIKDLHHQNKAYIMKLCWNLLTKRNCLWVRLLRAKYKCSDTMIPMIHCPTGASLTWRSICKVWDNFLEGVGWQVGKGDEISFWFDNWSPMARPLIFYALHLDHPIHHRVRDFSTSSGTWNIPKLKCHLPEEVVNRIISTAPPSANRQDDSLRWRPASNGVFSIKAAYNHISNHNPGGTHNAIWKKIWKWPTYEKIKFFLWKVAWNRLPLGDYREQTAGDSPLAQQAVIHTIRDTPEAKKVWLKLVKPSIHNTFFNLSVQDWLLWNARVDAGNDATRKLPWQRIFAQACWLIWKNKCHKTFSPANYKEMDVAFLSIHTVSEDLKLEKLKGNLGYIPFEDKMHWRPPEAGWVRLDTDGSVNRFGEASCGGVIRDSNGNWICGFAKKLGPLPSTMAELRGICEGLKICWNEGFRKIFMCTDSMEALNAISRTHSTAHPLFHILEEIRMLIMKNWEISYDHIFREANHCADWLAQYGHDMNTDFKILLDPPEDCRGLLRNDLYRCSLYNLKNS